MNQIIKELFNSSDSWLLRFMPIVKKVLLLPISEILDRTFFGNKKNHSNKVWPTPSNYLLHTFCQNKLLKLRDQEKGKRLLALLQILMNGSALLFVTSETRTSHPLSKFSMPEMVDYMNRHEGLAIAVKL